MTPFKSLFKLALRQRCSEGFRGQRICNLTLIFLSWSSNNVYLASFVFIYYDPILLLTLWLWAEVYYINRLLWPCLLRLDPRE